jgi:hypothetical protein
MISLSGLAATYPGYAAQEAQTATTDNTKADTAKKQDDARAAAVTRLGQSAYGNMLAGNGPQAPPPGQASVPAAPLPQAPPPQTFTPPPQQAGMPPATPQGAPPPAPRPPAAGPVPQTPAPAAGVPSRTGIPDDLNLKTLTQAIIQANPGIVNHPEILFAAVEAGKHHLDEQGKADLAEAKSQFATQRLQMAKDRLDETQRWHDQINDRGTRRLEQGDRRLDQGDTREARLAANSAVRNDAMTQRLQMQQQDLQRKIDAGDRGAALAQWRAVTDAMHKRATEIIQSNSAGSNMSDEDRKALLAEQQQAYENQIKQMRERAGGSTPTGGVTPTGQPVAPKVQGQVPPSAPGAPGASTPASAPPLAMLKPNTITTFANGQKWTVGPDGQPKQVQ